MSNAGRFVRLAAVNRSEMLAEELDNLADIEAAALASLDAIVASLRGVINRRDADAFGNQCAEALADALHDERSRLQEALTEAQQVAGDEI